MLESILLSIALTTHVGVNQDMNSIHPNLGYYVTDTVSVGTFYNSEKRVSFYTNKDFNVKGYDISIGIATGYSSSKIIPYVVISKQITEKVNVFVLPTLDSKTRNPALVFGIGLQIK